MKSVSHKTGIEIIKIVHTLMVECDVSKRKLISTICVIEFSKREKLTRRKGGFFFFVVVYFSMKSQEINLQLPLM